MLDRLRIQFDEKSILILGLGLIVFPILIELTGFRFTEHLSSGKDLLHQSPIGEIIRQRKTVRKRGETSNAFSRIAPGDALFVGDRILTGKEASARIHLTDGNILELGPESLIRIEPIRSIGLGGIKRKIKITLESGTVKAAVHPNSAPIVVENTQGEVLLETLPPPPPPVPAPLSAPPVAPEFVSAELPEPEKTDEARNTLVSLPPASPLVEAEKPVTEERPLLSRLTLALRPPVEEIKWEDSPKSGVLSGEIALPDQKFKLQWKSAGYARMTPYQIRISESGTVRTLESDKETVELPVPLRTSGEWQVFVESGMKNGETIRSRMIRFEWTLPAPQPVSPPDRTRLTPGQIPFFSKKLLLGWKEMPACQRFRIDVSRDEAPFHSAESLETTENFIAIPPPEAGVWKWRIHCIFGPGVASSSPVNRFTIEDGVHR